MPTRGRRRTTPAMRFPTRRTSSTSAAARLSSQRVVHDDVAAHRADAAGVGGCGRAVPGDRRRLAAARLARSSSVDGERLRGRGCLPARRDRSAPSASSARSIVRSPSSARSPASRTTRATTILEGGEPLGTVLRGVGNGEPSDEGVVAGELVGTQPARAVPADEPGAGRTACSATALRARGRPGVADRGHRACAAVDGYARTPGAPSPIALGVRL